MSLASMQIIYFKLNRAFITKKKVNIMGLLLPHFLLQNQKTFFSIMYSYSFSFSDWKKYLEPFITYQINKS